jgi:hypothetical protein
LTARQVGKTTTAAWAIAHAMVFMPGSLSVIACPAQRQSAEAVRRVRESLLKVGAKLVSDNVYGLELDNGARVLALPGSDDSIRGLTVDAWIVADEAARLSEDIIAALRPMRARRPQARLAMLSTAWSRTDPFWTAWASDDPTWIRLKATVDMDPTLFPADYLAQERKALGDHAFKREYLGIPVSGAASPFTWELYAALPAPHCDRRAQILALRGERRYPCPVRGRVAEAAHRGSSGCRYERLQCVGGLCRCLYPDPGGASRA